MGRGSTPGEKCAVTTPFGCGCFRRYGVFVKIRIIFGGFKDDNMIKSKSARKLKLYSRVFRIFQPNAVTIDPYNLELYHLVRFETQCI